MWTSAQDSTESFGPSWTIWKDALLKQQNSGSFDASKYSLTIPLVLFGSVFLRMITIQTYRRNKVEILWAEQLHAAVQK